MSLPCVRMNPPLLDVEIYGYFEEEMQEIIPGLYLGSHPAAKTSKHEQLLETGITHIVCVRHDSEATNGCVNFPEFKEQEFKYLVINFQNGNIIPIFPKVNSFIDGCFKAGGKVLVHSNSGISKSAALVIAYLMETKALSYSEANSLVLSNRYCVNVDEDFVNQLKEYEPIYKARSSHSKGHSSKLSGNQGKLKRTIGEAYDSEFNSNMEICEESAT